MHDALESYGIKGAPEAILTTHKHHDHAAHNQLFVNRYPDIKVISGANEPVLAATQGLMDGQVATLLGGSVTAMAIETPCHTAGHTMFEVQLAQGD